MKKTIGILAASVAMALSGGASAAVIQTIDLFTTTQPAVVDSTIDGAGVFSQNASFAADIIGGYRDLGVSLIANPNGLSSPTVMEVAGGFLSFSNKSGVQAEGLIRWDGSAAATDFSTPSFGLGAAFNPVGSAFELLTISSDSGYTFILEAYTSATQWSRVTLTAHEVDGSEPGYIPGVGLASYIPLFAFLDCDNVIPGAVTQCAGSSGSWNPVDWSNLGALQAIINPGGGTANLDLTLNQIQVVPEPASLALAGLGLLGLGAMRRRRTS